MSAEVRAFHECESCARVCLDLLKFPEAQTGRAQIAEIYGLAIPVADLADPGQSLFVKLFRAPVISARARAFTEIAEHRGAVATIVQIFINGQPLLKKTVRFRKLAELKMGDTKQLEARRKAGIISEFATKFSSLFSK